MTGEKPYAEVGPSKVGRVKGRRDVVTEARRRRVFEIRDFFVGIFVKAGWERSDVVDRTLMDFADRVEALEWQLNIQLMDYELLKLVDKVLDLVLKASGKAPQECVRCGEA